MENELGLMPDTPFVDDIEHAKQMYFSWLVCEVGMDRGYLVLAQLLHSIEFYWVLELDENRAKDGLRCREMWLEGLQAECEDKDIAEPIGALDVVGSGPCSVLEMLVGLATRIEVDVMQDDRYGDRRSMWIFAMLQNLGLTKYDDAHLDASASRIVRYRVANLLDRHYAYSGRGGLFPMWDYAEEDQREVEIWWQAQRWLAINYPD